MGPVDSISQDAEGTELTILGQRFKSSAAIAGVSVGEYVVAAGNAEELLVLIPLGSVYIPGASPITVRGQISSIDSSIAALSVGKLSLDYSPILSVTPAYSPQAGQTVQFSGIQPSRGGVAILTVSRELFGIHGGDNSLQGIHGGDSSLQGLNGGDLE
jgi:hypothetical protein